MQTVKSNTKEHIEVLYFHDKQRCATDNAIEKLMKEVIGKEFAVQLKDFSRLVKDYEKTCVADFRFYCIYAEMVMNNIFKQTLRCKKHPIFCPLHQSFIF